MLGQKVTVLSSGVVTGGCSINGGSFTGVILIYTIAVSHNAGKGVPSSHTT